MGLVIFMIVILWLTFHKGGFNGIQTFVSVLFFIMFMIIIRVYYMILNKLARLEVKNTKLNFTEFSRNRGYYREIIKEYSPAVLSYIDDYEIDGKDIIATLLYLKLQGYIDIINNKVILTNANFEELNKNERYLLQTDMNNYKITDFKEEVIADSLRNNLIMEEEYEYKNSILDIFVPIIILLIIICVLLFIFRLISVSTMLYACLLIICIFQYLYEKISPTYFYLRDKERENKPYVRSKIGNEINFKLEGLKNFLKDFSVLDKREIKYLELWGEYLIFSVLFNQNKKVIKEFGKILK